MRFFIPDNNKDMNNTQTLRHAPGRQPSRFKALFGVLAAILMSGCGAVALPHSPSPSSTSQPTTLPRSTPPLTTPSPTTLPSATPTPQPSDLLDGVVVTPANEAASAAASNALTVNLLQQLSAGQPDANFVDSAYSLATVLAMLELGANGETESQIAAVLQSAGVSPEQQAAAWKALDASLLATAKGNGISLDDANAIWLQEGLPFNATFLNTLVQEFSAPSSEVDFSGNPENAANLINQWVSSATNGMIPTVVSSSDVQSCKMVLADAIYFDANWKQQFDPSLTVADPSSCLTAVRYRPKQCKVICGQCPLTSGTECLR